MHVLSIVAMAAAALGNGPQPFVEHADKLVNKDGSDLTDSTGQRVIGGTDVSSMPGHDWVVQLSLVRNSRTGPEAYRCGGTLISQNVVLSAAHCFFLEDGTPMNYDLTLSRLYIGLKRESDKFAATPPHLTRTASCYKTHVGYDHVTQANDVAVLYLSEPVPSSWPVASLNSGGSVPVDVDVAGWGATNDPVDGESYIFPTVLMQATLNSMSNAACMSASAVFGALVKPTMLCAYYPSRDTCVGDSGGPLYSTATGSPVVYGITSWGIGCAQPDSPGVYTRVSSFHTWITNAVAELESNSGCTAGNAGESFGEDASSADDEFTVGGCRCSQAWAIGAGTCADVSGVVFSGCNMNPPCDADSGGVVGQSWCILETSDGCSPAGVNWDYCVPPTPETTSSTTTTEQTTTESTTSTTTTTTTTPEPTTTPATTINQLDLLDTYVTLPSTVPGYLLLTETGVCDETPGLNLPSSIRAYPGEHTHAGCTDFCESLFDCYFASMDWKGRCKFFQTCAHIASRTTGYVYARTSVPTTPEPSPTEGYTLSATGQVCDGSTGRAASRSSLGGGGYGIADCAQACDAQRDCFFFFFTQTGFCKMFAECNDLVPHGSADTVTYSRDTYKLESRVERCDKDVRGMISLGGGGHAHEVCRAACDADPTCAFYVWYSLKGYCHLFTHCGDDMGSPLIEGAHGSMLYSRVNGAKEPVIDGWTLLTATERCDKDSSSNVRAPRFSLGGGGWNSYDCAAGCAEQGADCVAFTWYPSSGFCHMFVQCAVRIPADAKGALTYETAPEDRPMK